MARVQLLIEVDDGGNLNVTGPLTDKVMCYGLLEAAKDAVRDHGLRNSADRARIVQAAIVPVPAGRIGRG